MPKQKSVDSPSKGRIVDSEKSRRDLGAFLRSGEFRRKILEVVEPAIQADERAVASSCVDGDKQRAL